MRTLFGLAIIAGVVGVWWVGQRELRRLSPAAQLVEEVRRHLEPLLPAGQVIDAAEIFLRRRKWD